MTAQTAAETPPWLSLPEHVAILLRPHVELIVTEIIQGVPRDVPEYARPMEGRFGQGLHRGVAVALDRFLDLPGSGYPALTPESRRVYAGLGRGEYRSGRQLGALLAAYRSGARVTFRVAARIAVEAGVGAETLVPLGESIFAYIDELSAASVQGYTDEQNEQVGEVERRRDELAGLLLLGRGGSGIHEAAAAASWRLPAELAVVVVPRDEAEGLRLALGRDALVVARAQDVVALVPAPRTPGARRELERALAGRGAVVGPSRAWEDVPESLRLTQLTMARATEAQESSAFVRPDPLFVEDHLTDVALAAEPAVLADLARLRLAPLQDLPAGTRDRLVDTLYQWLLHWGQRQPVAEALSVHPQTVGYRVAQLKELFGDSLEDARFRFELLVVLRAGHR